MLSMPQIEDSPNLQGNIFGWATAALMSGFKGVWSGRKSLGTSSPLSRPQLALGGEHSRAFFTLHQALSNNNSSIHGQALIELGPDLLNRLLEIW